jgi:hypothetical protein
MRTAPLLFVWFVNALFACSGSNQQSNDALGGSNSVAGSAGTGGLVNSGGSTSSVGTTGATGATNGTGGAETATGGRTGTGGTTSTGGSVGFGGSAVVGGALSSGGTKATGGTTNVNNATGGAMANTGGVTSAGGTTSKGGTNTGGTTSKGGASALGGSPSTGGTTSAAGSLGTGGSTGNGGAMTAATGGAKVGTGGSGGSGGATTAGSVTILPGAVWNDTQGNVIQAHGEGIIKVGGTYYWLGEDKTNGASFQNVKCYSSTDLKNWTFVSNVLTRQASGDLGPNRIIERPHVIYNSVTSQYVMYMHVDSSSYTDRKAGVATCSSVCGSYSYQGSVKPLGHDSLDDTLFQDGTTGYFLSEDRTNTKLQIYQLSNDYLTVSSLVATLPQYESPAVAKIGGTFFIFGSHLTGWATNDNQYTTASSMAGPWGAWKSFAPAGTNTCDSQVTFILPVTGTSTTTYVFLGDRWNSGNLTDSRYIWQPLTINGTTVSMTCATSWKIDTATGIWSP